MTETGFLFIYHDNGNLLTKSGNGENWQLEYNALNQLTRANISTPQGASVSEYAYDHDGIRVGKTINGTEMIQYVVDKNRPYAQVLEEERTNGLLSATTSYVYGDALISAATEGSTHYYHADGLGSVRGLSDASGALTDSYIYDAYGLLTTSSGATVNPYLYRGEQYDPELDAYYLRARYYQPGTGRFLTTDPVEGFPNAPISLHRYVYGNDTPVSMIDPSGQSSISDMLFAFTVINIGLSVSANQFQAIGNVYSTLGKYAFPDGPVLGITTDMPWYIWDLFNLITTTCNLPEALQHPTYPGFPGFNHIFGYEVLFSISSAQIGLFRVYGLGNGIGRDAKRTTMPLPDIGGSIYEGEVYNLWNAQNYAGPFYSINFSGITVAFSPMDVFMGPWGISKTVVGGNIKGRDRSFGGSMTNYEIVEPIVDFDSSSQVIVNVIAVGYLINIMNDWHNVGNLPNLLLNITYWWQLGLAKYHWNQREEHDIETRQSSATTEDAGRPEDFQSGPSLFLLER